MTVSAYSMTWEVGEDLNLSFTYKVGPSGSEEPVDLSSVYAVRMDIRSNDNSFGLLYTFNSSDITESPPVDESGSADNEITLGSDGTISIRIPRSVVLPGGAIYDYMIANNVSSYAYDIFLRNTDLDTQKKILKGTIGINQSVTRWA